MPLHSLLGLEMKYTRNKKSIPHWCSWALALLFCCVSRNVNAKDVRIHLNENVLKCFPGAYVGETVSSSLYPYTDLRDLSFNLIFTRSAELFQEARYKNQCDLYADLDRELWTEKEELVQEIENSGEQERGVFSQELRDLALKKSLSSQEIHIRLNIAVADEAARLEEWAIASAAYLSLVDTYVKISQLKQIPVAVPKVYPDDYLLGLAIKGFEITRPLAVKEQGREEDSMTDYFNELKTKVDEILTGKGG
ncbi:hypothetical protein [Roseibium sp. Sym1]|uniref:hypothetical protein n=1 Tax=Roseibium sp. Sym1 TaxID=3016006 RepID=UPI0022B3BB49|nr:hypothetical protein [Roseibium sp. Sym1]